MVNNAGLGTLDRHIRVHELEDEAWEKTMYASDFIQPQPIRTKGAQTTARQVNVRGPYLGSKFACAQFLKQDLNELGRRGWIVNVSSMLGFVGITGGAGRSTS